MVTISPASMAPKFSFNQSGYNSGTLSRTAYGCRCRSRAPPDDANRHRALRSNPSRFRRSHKRKTLPHLSPRQFGVIQEVVLQVAFQKKAQDPDHVSCGRRTASTPRHNHPSAAREDCLQRTNAPAVDQKPLAVACAEDPLPRPWMRRSDGLPERGGMQMRLGTVG